jgi:hypothetical protein
MKKKSAKTPNLFLSERLLCRLIELMPKMNVQAEPLMDPAFNGYQVDSQYRRKKMPIDEQE